MARDKKWRYSFSVHQTPIVWMFQVIACDTRRYQHALRIHPQVGTFSLRWPWNDASICMWYAVLSPLRLLRCPCSSIGNPRFLTSLCISLFFSTFLSLSLSRFSRRVCSPVGWLLLMSAGSLSILSPLVRTTLDLSPLCLSLVHFPSLTLSSPLSLYIYIFSRLRSSSLRLSGNRDFPSPHRRPT